MPNARIRAALLAELDGPTLVRRAVEEHGNFKESVFELERRPPDEAATDVVLEAYRTGAAPPWLAAVLLGRTRGDRGYEVARAILHDAPGLLAESYAGPAMARIRGEGAAEDLLDAMENATQGRSRAGAAYGLAVLQVEAHVDRILATYREGRLSFVTVAGVLADFPSAEPRFVEWLVGKDHQLEDLALAATFHVSAKAGGRLSGAFADAIEASLAARRIFVSESRREMFHERIERGRAAMGKRSAHRSG